MTVEQGESQVVHPTRVLHRKYVEPIIFLADRMAIVDGQVVPKERKLVEDLAKAAKMKNFRHERWYRDLDDRKACQAIDVEPARQAAMVVLSLVLKADKIREESEHEFFREIRGMIGAKPVTVPVDFEAHKTLAIEYLHQGR